MCVHMWKHERGILKAHASPAFACMQENMVLVHELEANYDVALQLENEVLVTRATKMGQGHPQTEKSRKLIGRLVIII